MSRWFQLSIVVLNLMVLAAAILVGMYLSWWLGLLTWMLLAIVAFHLFYNFDYWFVRQLTRMEPKLLIELCETGTIGLTRRLIGRLPSNPRCRVCRVPFAGFGALVKIKPSAKNSNFCRSCFEALPTATMEMNAGVLFADIRGYTAWAEVHKPGEAAEALSRFYSIADSVITRDDALIEFIGDQVMALYLPILPSLSGHVPETMVKAAARLVDEIKSELGSLPVGVGLNFGPCEVGNVKKGAAKDFTAIGDTVNTASRLQSHAAAHEIVMSRSVYDVVQESLDGVARITISAKGKAEPVEAFVLRRPNASE